VYREEHGKPKLRRHKGTGPKPRSGNPVVSHDLVKGLHLENRRAQPHGKIHDEIQRAEYFAEIYCRQPAATE
jgi:hypothetical protein